MKRMNNSLGEALNAHSERVFLKMGFHDYISHVNLIPVEHINTCYL